MGRKKGRRSLKPPPATPVAVLPPSHQEQQARTECFQGDRLTELLQKIGREIELERLSKGGVPDKIWIKRQFAIGVNEVSRVLERMGTAKTGHQDEMPSAICNGHKGPLVSLQAVLVASDCCPSYLTRHLPSLASSRGIPVIFVRDKRGGSLRLGELVNLKTAMAIGVKARGSGLNKAVEEVLGGMGFRGQIFSSNLTSCIGYCCPLGESIHLLDQPTCPICKKHRVPLAC